MGKNISIQPHICLLYKLNDRLLSIMSHFGPSSLQNLQKQHNTASICDPQTHQKHFHPSILYQLSPRQPKTTFLNHKFLGFADTPSSTPRQTLQTIGKCQHVQRNLFKDICNKPIAMKNPKDHQKEERVNNSSKHLPKPKISFSYKRAESNLQPPSSFFPPNYEVQATEAIMDRLSLSSSVMGSSKTLQPRYNLKLCSKELDYLILPVPSSKKYKKHSFFKEKKQAASKKLFTCSDSYNFTKKQTLSNNKESKISSTVATRSFQTDNGNTGPECGPFDAANSTSNYFNNIQKVKSPLMERLQPSKILKETMIESKYDFGGLFGHQPVSCKKDNVKKDHEQQSQKWRSYVKCLFDEGEDLKSSIHCGPDVRLHEQNREFLTGFGRSIQESCIADHQS